MFSEDSGRVPMLLDIQIHLDTSGRFQIFFELSADFDLVIFECLGTGHS